MLVDKKGKGRQILTGQKYQSAMIMPEIFENHEWISGW